MLRRLDAPHQREVHQLLEQLDGGVPAGRLDGVERHGPREGAHAAEQRLLRRLEQAVRPLERRAQAAMAVGRVARRIAEHVRGRLQAREQLGGSEDRGPGGRELDGEGKASDPLAHGGDRRRVIRARRPPRRRRARPLGEQRRRGVRLERVERHDRLAPHVQRRLAGDQDAQLRAALEQPGDRRASGQDLLEVVEDEQRGPAAEPRLDLRGELAGVVAEVERPCDRRQHARRIRDRREGDQERAAGQVVEQPPRDRQREARLAHAARADERHEARPVRKQRVQAVQVDVAPDERREFLGQVRRPRRGRAQRREVRRTATVVDDVEQPLRAREVLQPVLPEVLDLRVVAQQRAGRSGDEHLPAGRGGADARGAVDLDRHVAELVPLDVPRVRAHPHAQRAHTVRP